MKEITAVAILPAERRKRKNSIHRGGTPAALLELISIRAPEREKGKKETEENEPDLPGFSFSAVTGKRPRGKKKGGSGPRL